MPTCSICDHNERPAIETELLRRTACAKIAERYNVSWSAVWRHGQHLERSAILSDASIKTPVMTRLENLMVRLDSICAKATKSKEWNAAVLALREVRNCLELLAKMQGLISQGSRIQLAVGVQINSGAQPAKSLSNADLDRQIAQDVYDATNGFDPEVIGRMQRLLGEQPLR
jgi:hypothetical protein